MDSDQEENTQTVALYHEIEENKTVLQAVTNIWNLIQDAYTSDRMDVDADMLELYIDIEGHRNDEGGFSEDMYLMQKQLFINIIPAFVDTIHFPLGDVEDRDADLEEVLRADMERAAEESNEETYVSNLDDLPPVEEFAQEMDLVASYHGDSGSLLWGFGDKDQDLTTHLTQKELELET